MIARTRNVLIGVAAVRPAGTASFVFLTEVSLLGDP